MRKVKTKKTVLMCVLDEMKSGKITYRHHGICHNAYVLYTEHEGKLFDGKYYDVSLELKEAFQNLGLNIHYPVESDLINGNDVDFHYRNQEDKWDTENNPFAIRRVQLLDQLIEYFRKN
ncbi:hypothetical protein POP12_163 [Pectobacterium phage POP12]|nr:hypothetical protein POP12_163 [Pectobacterium phage POP12]